MARLVCVTISLFQQSDTFVLYDEPTLAHQGHQSPLFTSGSLWRFWEMCDTFHNCTIMPQRSPVLCLPDLVVIWLIFFLIILPIWPKFSWHWNCIVGFSYHSMHYLFQEASEKIPHALWAGVVVWEGSHTAASGTHTTRLCKLLSTKRLLSLDFSSAKWGSQ